MEILITLPSKVYILRPNGKQDIVRDTEEYSIYFSNIILPLKEEFDVRVECEFGANYGEFWRINTFPYDRDSFPLTIAIYDGYGCRVAEKSCTVYLIDRNKSSEYSILPIGDSMTHNTLYMDHLVSKLKNVSTRGLRSFNGHAHCEGRGGWTYETYFNSKTICWGGTSPFVFPKNVAGKLYFGDYEFEAMKLREDRPTYSYDGFPVFPLCNGMIYHKEGKLYRKEEPEDVLVEANPEWEVSFAKYMERYNPGRIDAVSLLMGGNDLQMVSYEDSPRIIAEFVDNTQKMIETIWDYDPNIQILLNLPIIGGEQYAWGKRMGCSSGSKLYRFNVIKAAYALLERFDKMENVHISGTLLNLDPVHGYDKEPFRANKYCDDYVMKHGNWVHPNANGYKQMGDALAAVVEAIRKD